MEETHSSNSQRRYKALESMLFYDQRSKINNLPNYRKDSLAGKLKFVVVFQAIEVERLSLEV